ncbi:hypothetical protein ACVOMV_36630 [Mesorhizobium atlanticum]
MIKDTSADVTVISVMHEAVAPRSLAGEEFYHSVVSIADGVATKKPLAPSSAARAHHHSCAAASGRGQVAALPSAEAEVEVMPIL